MSKTTTKESYEILSLKSNLAPGKFLELSRKKINWSEVSWNAKLACVEQNYQSQQLKTSFWNINEKKMKTKKETDAQLLNKLYRLQNFASLLRYIADSFCEYEKYRDRLRKFVKTIFFFKKTLCSFRRLRFHFYIITVLLYKGTKANTIKHSDIVSDAQCLKIVGSVHSSQYSCDTS